jgi:hypothetical protein
MGAVLSLISAKLHHALAKRCSAKRTEADFQARRDQEAWTAEKYRRFDRGERMPHDWQPRG